MGQLIDSLTDEEQKDIVERLFSPQLKEEQEYLGNRHLRITFTKTQLYLYHKVTCISNNNIHNTAITSTCPRNSINAS